jgi:hypothetical protein
MGFIVMLHQFAWLPAAVVQGFVMRGSGKFPALEAWFDAMESRPTYLGTKSDHYTQ